MLAFMITKTSIDQKLKPTVQKLKKFVAGVVVGVGVAASSLTGCASKNKIDQAIESKKGRVLMYKADQAIKLKEVPHMMDTSLNSKLLKKQKPIDAEFLRQQDELLNEICFSELYDLELNDENRAEQEAVALQKIADYCKKMKVMTQRVVAEYKKREQNNKKKYLVSDYEILSIRENMVRYCDTEVFKIKYRGVQLKNQGLPENTDINAVRVALQHCIHEFLDETILGLEGANPEESVAHVKYELGYGNFASPASVFYRNPDQQDIQVKMHFAGDHIMTDIINFAMYEYSHGSQAKNLIDLEQELESLFDDMQKALKTYSYQGKGSQKDMPLYYQSKQRLVKILSEAPGMFGENQKEKEKNEYVIAALIDQIGLTLAMLTVTDNLKTEKVDLVKLDPYLADKQQAEPELIK